MPQRVIYPKAFHFSLYFIAVVHLLVLLQLFLMGQTFLLLAWMALVILHVVFFSRQQRRVSALAFADDGIQLLMDGRDDWLYLRLLGQTRVTPCCICLVFKVAEGRRRYLLEQGAVSADEWRYVHRYFRQVNILRDDSVPE